MKSPRGVANAIRRTNEKKERIIEIRRYLHEHPELSFEEEETAKYIGNFYKEVPVDSVETNFGGRRGIVVTIKGSQPGKTIAIRADFDALPITEETGLPFASKNEGVINEKSLIISAKAMAAVVASYCDGSEA
jgi:metal-dependent amidase/aminoacylase/carboxypeptidase family protein